MPFPVMLALRKRSTALIVACFTALAFWYYYGVYSERVPILEGSRWDAWVHKVNQGYPIMRMTRLPSGKHVDIPRLQYDFSIESDDMRSQRLKRLAAVKSSFEHSWEGYKKHAWMKDEISPISGGYVTTFGGWAATLVDTLDTLWLMGLEQDFARAVKDISQVDFTTTESDELNVFETTIRYLGGFLGAYDLSNGTYPVLLQKATEVGDLLYRAFDTPNHMPVTRWRWKAAMQGEKQEAGENTLIAEIGSLTLEFTRLSQLTGDLKYFDVIERVTTVLYNAQSKTHLPGLWPVLMNAKDLTFNDRTFTLGGMADSLYEYLPKEHMLLGGLTQQYREMYEFSMHAIKDYIFFKPMVPDNADILVSGSARATENDMKVMIEPKGQHLGCFTGGMVGVGAKIFDRPDDMTTARKLVDGCIWAYDSMITGIMPEVFFMVPCDDPSSCEWDEKKWHEAVAVRLRSGKDILPLEKDRIQSLITDHRLVPGYTDISDRRYILRPEAIESIFILYRLTGDTALQDAAWRMFTAIEKHTRTKIANSAINDVTVENPVKDDRMESFWLAETLKYFFLVFSEPDVLSLDDYVLNTEAHPLRRPI